MRARVCVCVCVDVVARAPSPPLSLLQPTPARTRALVLSHTHIVGHAHLLTRKHAHTFGVYRTVSAPRYGAGIAAENTRASLLLLQPRNGK